MTQSPSLDSAVQKLVECRDEYFLTGTSSLSDDQYDALKLFVETNGHEVPPHPPSSFSGDWPEVEHLAFMPSMNLMADSGTSLRELVLRTGVDQVGTVSLKYDGLALELQYKSGKLAHVVLRGSGSRGEDILHNARHVPSIPLGIDGFDDSDFAVYGELVISWNNLKVLNDLREDDGKDPYKSPRNAVSVIRSKSANIHKCRLLTFKAYDTHPKVHSRQADNLSVLSSMSMTHGRPFKVVDTKSSFTVSALPSACASADQLRKDGSMQYQLDGLVFRSNDGMCVKYKFPASSAVARVVSIVEQLGRTGVVAPVIEVEPVELDHNTIRRASGHNVELIQSRLAGLGPGAQVLISRRGAVIPHLEGVVVPSDSPWEPRPDCPSCGALIVQTGSIRRCSADASGCTGTAMGQLIEFARRLGIEGFGPGVVSAIMSECDVTTPVDLYLLDPEVVAEAQQPGGGRIGTSIANKLCRAMDTRSEVGWGELLGALCIQGCAVSVMTDVAKELSDPDSLMDASKDRLMAINGVGPERAEAIMAYIDMYWATIVDPLLSIVSLARMDEGPLSEMTICISLGLNTCTRPQMEARIRQLGGTVKSSVSRKVTHLVCNWPDDKSSKITRAKSLRVPIISEDDLLEMMGGPQEIEEQEPDPNDDF